MGHHWRKVRTGAGLAAAGGAVAAIALAIPSGPPLAFTPPPGWVDVRREALAPTGLELPEAARETAVEDGVLGYWADLRPESTPGPDATRPTMIALRKDGDLTIDEGLRAHMAQRFTSQAPSGIIAHSTRFVEVQGVTCLLMETELRGGSLARSLQYIVPGSAYGATLTYVADGGSFERFRPVFEASAAATTGVQTGGPKALWAGVATLFTLASALVALFASVADWNSRRIAAKTGQASPMA